MNFNQDWRLLQKVKVGYYYSLTKARKWKLLYLLLILVFFLLSSCGEQKQEKWVQVTDDGDLKGNNKIVLEKTTENQNWRLIVHWVKDRDSLSGFVETYLPKSGNYFLMVYLTFERNPAFDKKEDIIKLSYKLGNDTYITSMSGWGNNEQFTNQKIRMLETPNPNDPHDRPFSVQIYFEVPKGAGNFQLLAGTAPPLELKE
jgi:hypothetical protein